MRNLKVLYSILTLAFLTGAGCLGVVSGYIGYNVAEGHWQKEKLNYEQRLGTESALRAQQADDYKKNFDVLASGIAQTQRDVQNLREKIDRDSLKRDRSSALALAAAQEASQQASSASQKAAALGQQLSAQQKVIVAKTDEAVSAAKATEKKIDTAVRPVAAVPARPWSDVGGR